VFWFVDFIHSLRYATVFSGYWAMMILVLITGSILPGADPNFSFFYTPEGVETKEVWTGFLGAFIYGVWMAITSII
jgi:hypothetical protein